MAGSHGFVAAVYACWTANSDLPRDVFGRDVQDLRRLRPGSGCRDRIPRSWRLAASRGRGGRPRRRSWRKLGFPGTQDDGRGHRRRNNSSLMPSPSRSAGLEGQGVRNHPRNKRSQPRSDACPAGFLRFPPELSFGSRRDTIADRPSVGCSVGIGATLNWALPDRRRRAQAAIIATSLNDRFAPEPPSRGRHWVPGPHRGHCLQPVVVSVGWPAG